MRRKRKITKIEFTFIVLLFFLATLNVSYSMWTQDLQIKSEIGTMEDFNYLCLEGYWTLNETTGTNAPDSSMNQNNGAVYGAATWVSGAGNGIDMGDGVRRCLSFDGLDDYVGMGDILDFERTDTYTLIAWIKTSAKSGAIIAKMNVANNYQGYDMIVENGTIEAYLVNNWGANDAIKVEASTIVNDSLWHHIAVTYDGSSTANGLKIYIDGSPETVTIVKDSLSSSTVNSDELRIGTRIGHIPFTGLIDEVKIYSFALTADDILADYNAGNP